MQDKVFYGHFWKRYASELFDRVQNFFLIFFIIPVTLQKPQVNLQAFFIQCCQEHAVKHLSAFPWAQGCISRQPAKERQIMGHWWKLARNSRTRSIWFLLFIRTSLSVVTLDIDPRAFISLIIGATIYQNSQRVLSVYLN